DSSSPHVCVRRRFETDADTQVEEPPPSWLAGGPPRVARLAAARAWSPSASAVAPRAPASAQRRLAPLPVMAAIGAVRDSARRPRRALGADELALPGRPQALGAVFSGQRRTEQDAGTDVADLPPAVRAACDGRHRARPA